MALQSATATFNGTQDNVAVTWTAMPASFGISGGETVTDGNGPTAIWTTARSSTGCTVNTSARFTGTVEDLVWDHA